MHALSSHIPEITLIGGTEQAYNVLADGRYYTKIYEIVLHDAHIDEMMKNHGMLVPEQVPDPKRFINNNLRA